MTHTEIKFPTSVEIVADVSYSSLGTPNVKVTLADRTTVLTLTLSSQYAQELAGHLALMASEAIRIRAEQLSDVTRKFYGGDAP